MYVCMYYALSRRSRQRLQGNVQKSVRHVQSCCFANLNLCFFAVLVEVVVVVA